MSHEMELITELKNSVDWLGVDGTISALRNARVCHTSDVITQKIITHVCQRIGITVAQFRDYKFRNDKRKVAICFCVYFLHSEEFFDLSHSEISRKLPLGLSKQSMHNYFAVIKNAKLKNPKSNIDMLISNHLTALIATISPLKISA